MALGGMFLFAVLLPVVLVLIVSRSIWPVGSRYALPVTVGELAVWLGLLALSFQWEAHWSDWIGRAVYLAFAADSGVRAYRIAHTPSANASSASS
jgi:hypothetical protein